MKTICRDCVFATWDGDDQEDCRFQRLDAFENNGAKVVVEDDGRKRYLAIHGRFCNAVSNEDSLKDVPRREWKNHVADRFAVHCEMVVFADRNSDIADVERSVRSIMAQRHAPKVITIATNDENSEGKYLGLIKRVKPQTKWRIEYVGPPPSLEGFEDRPSNFLETLDRTLIHSKQTYYSICIAGFEFPDDYLLKINRAINYDMVRILAIRPFDGENGLFVQTGLHQALYGNSVKSVLDKIVEIAEEQGSGHIIKDYQDL